MADLKMGYIFNKVSAIDKLKLSLEFTNLFDEEYVSVINSLEDTWEGNTSYLEGALFTAMLTASFDF